MQLARFLFGSSSSMTAFDEFYREPNAAIAGAV